MVCLDSSGKDIVAPQQTPVAVRRSDLYLEFNVTVYVGIPVEDIPAGDLESADCCYSAICCCGCMYHAPVLRARLINFINAVNGILHAPRMCPLVV